MLSSRIKTLILYRFGYNIIWGIIFTKRFNSHYLTETNILFVYNNICITINSLVNTLDVITSRAMCMTCNMMNIILLTWLTNSTK